MPHAEPTLLQRLQKRVNDGSLNAIRFEPCSPRIIQYNDADASTKPLSECMIITQYTPRNRYAPMLLALERYKDDARRQGFELYLRKGDANKKTDTGNMAFSSTLTAQGFIFRGSGSMNIKMCSRDNYSGTYDFSDVWIVCLMIVRHRSITTYQRPPPVNAEVVLPALQNTRNDETCPVCYADLSGSPAVDCSACNHPTHFDCLQAFHSANGRCFCPQCRHPTPETIIRQFAHIRNNAYNTRPKLVGCEILPPYNTPPELLHIRYEGFISLMMSIDDYSYNDGLGIVLRRAFADYTKAVRIDNPYDYINSEATINEHLPAIITYTKQCAVENLYTGMKPHNDYFGYSNADLLAHLETCSAEERNTALAKEDRLQVRYDYYIKKQINESPDAQYGIRVENILKCLRRFATMYDATNENQSQLREFKYFFEPSLNFIE